MDIEQLKLLAGRIRDLLQQSQHFVGHNQSLDLSAALPGLRNWPEVQAFPDRVAACELDMASASRLAFRLKKKFEVDLAPQALLQMLAPAEAEKRPATLQIWPGGPASGVYITESQEAIDALLERYEEATDGALVYSERAGNHWPGSIDLGESGLWSSGLDRVPSGTLLIVGPLQLDQQSWKDSGDRLEMACLHAQTSGHRVAVLIETPQPQAMFNDVRFLVSDRPEGDESEKALIGEVGQDGDLRERRAFASPWPRPSRISTVAAVEAIPGPALSYLREVLAERKFGILQFGSSDVEEHPAIDLIAASLALTEHVGPAARIMPRHRGTPAKDWDVPEAIKALPFLPSVQSAYAQGYRRIIFDPFYMKSELLLKYSEDALLICGMYGTDAMDVFMSFLRGSGFMAKEAIAARTIAILSVIAIAANDGERCAADLMVLPGVEPGRIKEFKDLEGFLQSHRVLKWEDDVVRLLEDQQVSVKALQDAMPRNGDVAKLLASMGRRRGKAGKVS